MPSDIPQDVKRFIAAEIKSLEQLEVLLLISALPDRDWTVDGVFQVVQTNRDVVRQRLDEFVARQLVVRNPDGSYRYAPRDEAAAQQVATLSQLYKLRRHNLIELIYAPRADELHHFSNAFRFKKE